MTKKILVVDDDKLVTKSLSMLLSKKGYDTTSAGGGMEAVNKARAADFDLIICDIRMPDLDGIETIKQIRSHLEQASKRLIPEILISGYSDEDKHKEAMNLRVVGYLLKPLDNEEFLQIVQDAIK